MFFGWVVFGVMFRGYVYVYYVFNVKVLVFIDMVDFWLMEIMGVVVKFCNCEIDKLSLIEWKEVKVIEDFC